MFKKVGKGIAKGAVAVGKGTVKVGKVSYSISKMTVGQTVKLANAVNSLMCKSKAGALTAAGGPGAVGVATAFCSAMRAKDMLRVKSLLPNVTSVAGKLAMKATGTAAQDFTKAQAEIAQTQAPLSGIDPETFGFLLAAASEDVGVLGDAFAGLEDEQLAAALQPSTGLYVALGLSGVVALGGLILVLTRK
jgi:hypothetical protein